jgi:penicillin amidase
MAAGSNGKVAWAPTNANLDLLDMIALELDPQHPERYRVPEGWAEFEKVTETIAVRGGEPVELTTRWTIWGPVVETTPQGVPVYL